MLLVVLGPSGDSRSKAEDNKMRENVAEGVDWTVKTRAGTLVDAQA